MNPSPRNPTGEARMAPDHPTTQVIRLLDEQISDLQRARDILQKWVKPGVNGTPDDSPRPSLPEARQVPEASKFAKLTNVDATDVILRESPDPLTVKEILADAKGRGKPIKKTSLRWVIQSGVREGRYVRYEESPLNRYWWAEYAPEKVAEAVKAKDDSESQEATGDTEE